MNTAGHPGDCGAQPGAGGGWVPEAQGLLSSTQAGTVALPPLYQDPGISRLRATSTDPEATQGRGSADRGSGQRPCTCGNRDLGLEGTGARSPLCPSACGGCFKAPCHSQQHLGFTLAQNHPGRRASMLLPVGHWPQVSKLCQQWSGEAAAGPIAQWGEDSGSSQAESS